MRERNERRRQKKEGVCRNNEKKTELASNNTTGLTWGKWKKPGIQLKSHLVSLTTATTTPSPC